MTAATTTSDNERSSTSVTVLAIAFNEVLTFHFGKIQIVRLIGSKNEILPYRLQLALLRKELEGLAQVRPP